jgi:hypothetical protein
MTEELIYSTEGILDIIKDVPDYQTFYTVDELKASTHQLAKKHPDRVKILSIGHSRQGDSVEAIRIGNGTKRALLFALPHPNEPIGSMMLEYLSFRLTEDDLLRESLDYTWYLVKCIDPDGTRLNEGWFKGPFSIENYARHFYRPPSFHQVEWTFPIDYNTIHFHTPLPETQALMALIEEIKPDFLFSLHNSGFGGVYFYITEGAPPLYEPFRKLVESQGLPMHLGEPETPYEIKYADAFFKMTGVTEQYDFLKQHTDTDPAETIKGGTISFDYARRYCNPFGLVCEVPYYFNPSIGDTSASDIVRRDAILKAVEEDRKSFGFLQEQYDRVKGVLSVPSPFRDSIEETLKTYQQHLAAEDNWIRNDPRAAQMATIAEKFDNMGIRKFYRLFPLGMFIRLLQAQIEFTGKSPLLASAHQIASAAFEALTAELEADLNYTVIPIQKLVRVQLGSALMAAQYATTR